MHSRDLTFEYLRQQVVGIDSSFDTPFGRRLMTYCDYTASGRCLAFVERYLGPDGPTYLVATLEQPRWLIKINPTNVTT